MDRITLNQLHEHYVKHTPEEAVVSDVTIFLCKINIAVQKGIGFTQKKVHITARCVKHLYDKKPAEEYDAVLANLTAIIRFPTKIFENKGGKRGSYCLIKEINEQAYLVSLEEVNLPPEGIYVATAFRVRNPRYLDGYRLIWSREDGGSPS